MKLSGLFLVLMLVISTSTEFYDEATSLRRQARNWFDVDDDCGCEHVGCKCCGSIELFGQVINACIEFKILTKDLGVEASITINDFVLLGSHMSLRDPPPLCAEWEILKICIQLYDMEFHEEKIHGCLKISEILFFLGDIEIGCLDIPISFIGEI